MSRRKRRGQPPAPEPGQVVGKGEPELPEGWEWADSDHVRAETIEREDGDMLAEGFFHAYETDEGPRFYGERAPLPVVLAVLSRAGLLHSPGLTPDQTGMEARRAVPLSRGAGTVGDQPSEPAGATSTLDREDGVSRRKRRGQPPAPEPGQVVGIVEGVAFDCPACAGRVQLGYDQHGRPVGMHQAPPCAIFDQLELDEYATWARQKIQGLTT